MTDEKEQGFKIADRRRYNPDGSLRESAEEMPAEEVEVKPEGDSLAEPSEAQAEAPVEQESPGEEEATGNADNVVSFPGTNPLPAPEEESPQVNKPKAATAKAAAASAVSASQAASQQATQAAQAAQQAAIENAYNQASGDDNPNLPQASFLSLLNMLGVEAAMHLGLMEMQDGQRTPVDLEAARHMIDMLGMLKEKTQSNLTADEEALMENVLADLRMQFVALSRKG
jgi:hypothetical protein